MLTCEICDRQFATFNGLRTHRSRRHPVQPPAPRMDRQPHGEWALLLKCRHCRELQLELIDLRHPPESLICVACSNHAAERDGTGLCEREARRPWADWTEIARRTITGASALLSSPGFEPGLPGVLDRATARVLG